MIFLFAGACQDYYTGSRWDLIFAASDSEFGKIHCSARVLDRISGRFDEDLDEFAHTTGAQAPPVLLPVAGAIDFHRRDPDANLGLVLAYP
jgi:hypothetical protein